MTKEMSSSKTKPGRVDPGKASKNSVQICKTWFEFIWTRYGKLLQSKSSQALKELTERQHWVHDNFNFHKSHIKRRASASPRALSHHREDPV